MPGQCAQRPSAVCLMSRILCLLFLLFPICVCAEENDREARSARGLVEQVQFAEPVWLQMASRSFLSLYTAPRVAQQPFVFILLPALGMHPDWPVLIRPLRLALAAVNRGSLSVQLPLPEPEFALGDYDALVQQAEARVRVAIRYLEQQQMGDTALIGYGFGALLAARILADSAPLPDSLVGMVSIGIQDYPFLRSILDVYSLMESVSLPVLDIYPETAGAAGALDRRIAARRAGNRHYSQIAFSSGSAQFSGRERDLAELIVAWSHHLSESPPPVPGPFPP